MTFCFFFSSEKKTRSGTKRFLVKTVIHTSDQKVIYTSDQKVIYTSDQKDLVHNEIDMFFLYFAFVTMHLLKEDQKLHLFEFLSYMLIVFKMPGARGEFIRKKNVSVLLDTLHSLVVERFYILSISSIDFAAN